MARIQRLLPIARTVRRTYLLLPLLALLAACDTEPRRSHMRGESKRYIGSWVHDWVDPKDPSRYVRVYLQIEPDASAIYKRCLRNAVLPGLKYPQTEFIVIDHDAYLSMAFSRFIKIEYRKYFWVDDHSIFVDGGPHRHNGWPTVTLDGIRLWKVDSGSTVDHRAGDCDQ